MSDLISKEEAVAILLEAKEAGCVDKYTNAIRKSIFDEAIECIQDIPTVEAELKWIPVSEQLPDFGVDVLVCNDEGVQVTAKRTGWSIDPNCWAINYCGYDYDSWDFMANGNIVAWMPLPKAYEVKYETDRCG